MTFLGMSYLLAQLFESRSTLPRDFKTLTGTLGLDAKQSIQQKILEPDDSVADIFVK